MSGKWIGDREYHTFSVVVALRSAEDPEAVAWRVARSKPNAKLQSSTSDEQVAEHHRTTGGLDSFDVEEIREPTDPSEPVIVWEDVKKTLPPLAGSPSPLRDRGITAGTPRWKARYYA